MEQRDAVADALHALQKVRGHQHRHAVALERADHVEQFRGGMRIEAGGRLVEDRDRNLFHQDLGKPEPLPHAAGEVADVLVAHVAEPDAIERGGDPRVALGDRNADQAGGVAEIVRRRHVIVEADGVRQIADQPLDLQRLAHRVVSHHANRAVRSLRSGRASSGWSWSCRPRSDRAGRRSRHA